MIIPIQKYQTRDKREFTNYELAEQHEKLLDRIDNVVSMLVPIPDTCEFSNGHGFIRQDPRLVQVVKESILDLWDGDLKTKLKAKNVPAHWSIIGRIFSDENSPLQKPWYRLICIDEHGREWGQPFFARNPDQGEQIQLNP